MFIITRHSLYCLLHASLVLPYWACFLLFHFHHWFTMIGHCLYCCNSRFTGSFLLGMVYIVSLHALLVPPYWLMFVLCYFSHWFIFTVHGLHCFTSLTGSSLLGMVRFVALPSLVHHYRPWFMLLHLLLHWFIIIGHGLYCFASCFTSSPFLWMCCIVSLFFLTCSSLLGTVCIVLFHASLFHH